MLEDKIQKVISLGYKTDRQRTEEENQEYQETLLELQDNFNEVFEAQCGKMVAYIRQGLPQGVDRYWEMLGSEAAQPPVLPNHITTPYLNAIAIPQIYQAQSTIMGALEVLISRKTRWASSIKTIEATYQAVFPHTKPKQLSANLQILMPEVYSNMAIVEELIEAYEARKSALANAYSAVSRIITLRTSTPTEEISRIDPLNYPREMRTHTK